MATYHCSVKKGKVGHGARHADYILREGVYGNGTKKEDLVCKHSGNLPEWAENARDFWAVADARERANANVYYEFEIALPNELPLEENLKIVNQMIENHIGNKAYSFAIHEKNAALAKEAVAQPHAHIMFSERIQDGHFRDREKYFARANRKNPERGGAVKDDRFTKSFSHGASEIVKIREACEKYINEAYRFNGRSLAVSSASLEKQRAAALAAGDLAKAEFLNRTPENHLGPKIAQQVMRQAETVKTLDNQDSFFFAFC